jgi:phosphoglycerate dehydrogenase-like enzyme
MRVSRWGWSSYETTEALAAEAARLMSVVEVLPPRSDAEVVTVNSGTRVNAELLDQIPSARLVLTTTSGYDHLDLSALRQRGIAAGRCPLARRDAVVESSLGLLLDGLRSHAPLRHASEHGRWARNELPHLQMRLLSGARVGVVGLGVIGRRMAEVLQLLGAEVFGTDPAGVPDGVHATSLADLIDRCDAVTVHCRLEASSTQLIDAERIGRCRGLVLVNTSRGHVVDVPAAMEAVKSGKLHYLGLDVFPREPWPDLGESAHPSVVFLPHAAGFHRNLTQAIASELEQSVAAFAAGAPLPHPVGERP